VKNYINFLETIKGENRTRSANTVHNCRSLPTIKVQLVICRKLLRNHYRQKLLIKITHRPRQSAQSESTELGEGKIARSFTELHINASSTLTLTVWSKPSIWLRSSNRILWTSRSAVHSQSINQSINQSICQ